MEPAGSLPHSQVPATCPYLNQLDPVHTPTSHFLKIHLNIILPSTPGSPKRSLSIRFHPPKPCIHLFSSPIHATWSAHLILLDFITRTILGAEYRSLSSSLCSFLHSLCESRICVKYLFHYLIQSWQFAYCKGRHKFHIIISTISLSEKCRCLYRRRPALLSSLQGHYNSSY